MTNKYMIKLEERDYAIISEALVKLHNETSYDRDRTPQERNEKRADIESLQDRITTY